MAKMATGQSPPGVVQPPLPSFHSNKQSLQTLQPKSYASILNPNEISRHIPSESTPEPTIEYHHGEPSFVWEDKDVEKMVMREELQYGVVGKFAYGMPDFHELKKQIPLQLDLKGECCIGFLDHRHILIRISILEDYVHVLSRPAFYIKIGHRLHQMRSLKYEVWFDPNEETSIGVAWISFPCLPPVFFAKETVFSLAKAVGKPLQLDAATEAKSRPSCAKVKIEIDLLAARPQRVRIGIKNSTTGETRSKWIRIKYDYVPKYCKECRLQGHSEEECYVLHPELEQKNYEPPSVNVEQVRLLQSGKVVGNVNKRDPLEVLQQSELRQPSQEKNGDKFDSGQPTHVQGNQRRKGSRFMHPNRKPNAWGHMDPNKKQGTEPAQIEAVPTTNSFTILEREEAESQELQRQTAAKLEPAVLDIVQEETRLKEGVDLEKVSAGYPTPGGTRAWVENKFKEHPKNQVVGEIVISGKDAMKIDKETAELVALSSQPEAEEHAASAGAKEYGHGINNKCQKLEAHAEVAAGVGSMLVPKFDAPVDKVTLETKSSGGKQPGDEAVNENILRMKEKGALIVSAQALKADSLKHDTVSGINAMTGQKDFILAGGNDDTIKHGDDASLQKDSTRALIPVSAACIKVDTKQHGEDGVQRDSANLEGLIPTAELERICKSSSSNFGKSYFNITAPPFVPKSLMHPKKLPSDDELIKQMNLHDTKGFLARRGCLVIEPPLQGESEDISEEEELNDKSTAYNLATVGRQGVLSPTDVSKPSGKTREMRHLQPTRVQPGRRKKSKSKKYNKY